MSNDDAYRSTCYFFVHIPDHGRMNYKDTELYSLHLCRLIFKIDLLTDFAALCSTDFIDWRYIHSWLVFLTQLVNCCPHPWTTVVYCCPSTFSLTFPPPSQTKCTAYTDNTWLWGGGGWEGCLNSVVDHSLQEFIHSEPTKMLHHPKQKWPVMTTLKGQCHEIFCFWFFSYISFPPAPECSIKTVSNFFENSQRYSQLKVSLTPVANGKNLQSEKF